MKTLMHIPRLRQWAKEGLPYLRLALLSSDYRHTENELHRLARLRGRPHAATRLLGPMLEINHGPAFVGLYREIVERGVYDFCADTERPYIIDGGAHIGLATIAFKRRFPGAEIDAFEPDPTICGMLRRNLHRFGFGDVQVHPAALWTKTGVIPFLAEGVVSSRVPGGAERADCAVVAERLHDYLDRRVDFLKLDIEGAEVDVLADCAGRLDNVQALFVEYHSWKDRPQRLAELFSTLQVAGFRVTFEQELRLKRPFLDSAEDPYCDLLVNIYARRDPR